VWELDALLWIKIIGMPVEELLFAAAIGTYWSGVYDHVILRRIIPAAEAARQASRHNQMATAHEKKQPHA